MGLVLNPPNIKDNIDINKKFVDFVISTNIPSGIDNPMLFEHSKFCTKYKNKSCRFNFGQFFKSETIIPQAI